MNYSDDNTEYQFDNTLSLYIPIISDLVTEMQIKNTFKNLEIGNVSRVDFINKTVSSGIIKKQAFVHFDNWFDTLTAKNLQTSIVDSNINAKLVYDDPKFWPLLPAHNPEPEQPEHAKEENQKTIEMIIMKNKIQELEKIIDSLNIKNCIHEENIKSLMEYKTPSINNSWENLSGELYSQSEQNKRMKPMPYQACKSLYNAIRSPYSSPMVSPMKNPNDLEPPPIYRQPNLHSKCPRAEPSLSDTPSPTTVKNINSSCCNEISNAWIPNHPPEDNEELKYHAPAPPPPPPSPP